ncbi:MAG TPA: hypothetical protein VMS17_07045, partial [Gemmataceae bacterium]|nr:hypothetical protein [Gemmataceae bacterium]
AADGYAVGGLTLRSGLDINGMSVTFMRIKDGKLDPQDSYESDWVGEKRGGEGTIGGEGAPVVAVIGNQDSEKICALGLTFTTMPAAAVSPPANAQPPGREAFQPPPAPARTPANPPPVIAPIDDPPARHDAPAQPPAAPAADNAPAQPPAAAAVEPAPEAPAAPAKRAVVATPAEQAAANPVLTYAVPAAAFLSIAGLIGLAVVTTIRRRNQAARRPANRPSAPRPPVAQAAPLDYTGILERPLPRAVPLPAYHGEVLELQPEDFLPDPPPAADHAPAPKPAPASSDDWPRLEL